MWELIFEYTRPVLRFTHNWDRQQWLVVFAILVVVGGLCMRGFGSRNVF